MTGRSLSERSESLNEQAIADVRWRLEQAMEDMDGGLPMSAIGWIEDARKVIEAMWERWQRERREQAREYRKADV